MCGGGIAAKSCTVTDWLRQISFFAAVGLAGEQSFSAREPTSGHGQFAIDETHESQPKRAPSCILNLAEIQELLMRAAIEFTSVSLITQQVCGFRDSF